MAAKPGQKTFHAEVDPALHEALEKWRSKHKDPPQKQCIVASVELFLALPEPVQALLMICDRNSPYFASAARIAANALLSVHLDGSIDDVRLAEETLDDAEAIEAEMLGKKAGTRSGSRQSRKSPGHKRQTG